MSLPHPTEGVAGCRKLEVPATGPGAKTIFFNLPRASSNCSVEAPLDKAACKLEISHQTFGPVGQANAAGYVFFTLENSLLSVSRPYENAVTFLAIWNSALRKGNNQPLEWPAQVTPSGMVHLAGPSARDFFLETDGPPQPQDNQEGGDLGRQGSPGRMRPHRVPALNLSGALSPYKPGLNLHFLSPYFKGSKYFLFLPTVYIFQMLAGLLKFP